MLVQETKKNRFWISSSEAVERVSTCTMIEAKKYTDYVSLDWPMLGIQYGMHVFTSKEQRREGVFWKWELWKYMRFSSERAWKGTHMAL